MKETVNTNQKETRNAAERTAEGAAFERQSEDTAVGKIPDIRNTPDEVYRLTGEGLAIMGTMLDVAMQQLSDAVDVAGTIYDLMNTCSEAARRDRHQTGRDEGCKSRSKKSGAIGETAEKNKADERTEADNKPTAEDRNDKKESGDKYKDRSDENIFFINHLMKAMNGPFSAMEMVVDTDLDASIMDELSMLHTCEWFGLDDEVAEIPDLDDMFFAYAQDDSTVRKDGSILITGPVVVFKLDEDGETIVPSLEELTRAFVYLGTIAVTEKTGDGKKLRAFLLN